MTVGSNLMPNTMFQTISRSLWRVFVVVCSIVFIANCTMWVVSHWRIYSLQSYKFMEPGVLQTKWLNLESGRVSVSYSRRQIPPKLWTSHRQDPDSSRFTSSLRSEAPRLFTSWSYTVRTRANGFDFLGLEHTKGISTGILKETFSNLYIPCSWIATVTGSVILTAYIRRTRARRRLAVDRICLKCGYDLRASTERCPECGTPISTSSGVTASSGG